ncbi:HAD family hydrolase [Nocardioides gansuensis]|uniref:HAD family hydrolase n=1 Tax=Nocardioides gansuensis TaxID=2138300 RepID=UPI001403815F|nr:HAD-IA family hydrolase [Nocardioides gansuensis]
MLLNSAQAVLLDFDGPIAELMPPPVNSEAATAARQILAGIELPYEIETSTDHLAVLRWARIAMTAFSLGSKRHAPAEVQAAEVCAASVHAAAFMEFGHSRDLPLAIVSNNSSDAVRTALARWHWLDRIAAFACRTPDAIDWMKPSPRLLLLAADVLHVNISRTVFVEDAVSDVVAAKAAGAPLIGLAKSEARANELGEAGADLVADLRDGSALGLGGLG